MNIQRNVLNLLSMCLVSYILKVYSAIVLESLIRGLVLEQMKNDMFSFSADECLNIHLVSLQYLEFRNELSTIELLLDLQNHLTISWMYSQFRNLVMASCFLKVSYCYLLCLVGCSKRKLKLNCFQLQKFRITSYIICQSSNCSWLFTEPITFYVILIKVCTFGKFSEGINKRIIVILFPVCLLISICSQSCYL